METGENHEAPEEFSSYNEAGLQIARLNEYWIKAERYANGHHLIAWSSILDSIYRELYPDVLKMKDSKNIQRNHYLIKVNSKKAVKLPENSYFIDKKVLRGMAREHTYNWLDKRHRFLKEIQDSCGKGSKYVEGDNEAFE